MNPANNPPVTAGMAAGAINACILAFTNMTGEQDAAICAVVVVVCAWIASRFTTPAKWV